MEDDPNSLLEQVDFGFYDLNVLFKNLSQETQKSLQKIPEKATQKEVLTRIYKLKNISPEEIDEYYSKLSAKKRATFDKFNATERKHLMKEYVIRKKQEEIEKEIHELAKGEKEEKR
jgi:hypothetical protein